MKILHVIHSLDPACGGPPAVTTRLAAAESTLGHSVSIVSHRTQARSLHSQTGPESIPGSSTVEFEFLPAAQGIHRFLTRGSRRVLGKLIEQSQIVHLHGLWDPIVKISASICQRYRIPYVLAPHGMLYPWSLEQKRLKKKLAMALGYRRMLANAALLHVLNEDEERSLLHLGLSTRTVELPNGVFEEEVDATSSSKEFEEKYPKLTGSSYILFLGRLHHGKGLPHLARAFAKVALQNSRIQLVVAGPDQGERKSFERLVDELSLGNRVHILGPVDGALRYSALAGALCFCLPSEHEAFSMAILEALVCGTPVVISDHCHFPEVARMGAGLISALDPDALADSLSRLIDNPDLGHRLSLEGKKLVLSRYTWPKIARDAVEAYREIIEAPDPD